MTAFVGRFAELRRLTQARDALEAGNPHGQCVLISGPGGVGKSRLIGEFLLRARARTFLYAAPRDGLGGAVMGEVPPTGTAAAEQLAAFSAAAGVSELPHAERFRDILTPDWDTALRLLSDAIDTDEPAIVVLDNASALVAADRSFPSALRRSWQRLLSGKRVLLVVIGRDLTPLAGALGDEAVSIDLAPFNPAELGEVLALDAANAFDAYVVTGGHADITAQWPTGAGVLDALEAMLSRSPSVFEIRAELFLARELGLGSQAESLLVAAGPLERSRAAIGRSTRLPAASLDRALKQLVATGLLAAERPLSLRPSREARYRIDDPYLRFWLQTIAPHREDIARGHVDAVLADAKVQWQGWRAAAMHLISRQAMGRLARAGKLPGTGAVGGFWNRFEDVRVDLVGTDAADDPTTVTFVGSFTWEAGMAFDHYDLASLIAVRDRVPGVTAATPLVAVTLGGSAVGDAVAAVLGPDELISAWAE